MEVNCLAILMVCQYFKDMWHIYSYLKFSKTILLSSYMNYEQTADYKLNSFDSNIL